MDLNTMKVIIVVAVLAFVAVVIIAGLIVTLRLTENKYRDKKGKKSNED